MNKLIQTLVSLTFYTVTYGQVNSITLDDVENGNNISLQWSTNPKILYTGTTNGQIYQYDIAAGTNSLYREIGADRVYSLALSKNGTLYATSNETGYIFSKEVGKTLTGHNYKVDDIAVSSVNGLIATGSRDNSVIIWNADGSLKKQIKAHDEDVLAVAFSPDGELLASSSKDKTVKIWEAYTGRLLHTFASASNTMGDLIFSNDGTRLFAAGSNGIIICWSTKGWSKLFTLECLPGVLSKISISRDDQFLAAAGEAKKVALFDLGSNTKEMLESVLPTIDLQFSLDGKNLAALCSSGKTIIWDMTSKKIGDKKFPFSDRKAILAVSDFQLIEKYKNGIVEPGDNPEIKFSVTNKGNGRAYDVTGLFSISGSVQGLKIPASVNLESLDSGATVSKTIQLELGKELTSGNATIEFYATAANEVQSDKKATTFQTKGTAGLAYLLVSEPIFSTPEGFVKKGLPVTLKYKFKNIGPEAARDVNVKFTLPANVIAANKLIADYTVISANSTLEDSLLFYADKNFEGSKIDISMKISGATTGQETNNFSVNIGQDIRPKIDSAALKPTTTAAGTNPAPGNNDPGENEFSVDTDIPVAAGKNENRIALIIGNENYKDFNTKVDFAGNDARIFKEYASKLLGVEQDNLFYLQDATTADVRSAIEKVKRLTSLMNGRAEVIVYYSGAVFVDDYFRDEYLLPVDLRTNKLDDYFTLQNILNTLSDPKHNSITAYIDGTRLFESRLKPFNTSKAARNFYLYGNTNLLKATTGSQSAAGSEKLKHGLFTYYLLKKYKLDKTNTHISKQATYTEEQVRMACFRMGLPEQVSELRISSAK